MEVKSRTGVRGPPRRAEQALQNAARLYCVLYIQGEAFLSGAKVARIPAAARFDVWCFRSLA